MCTRRCLTGAGSGIVGDGSGVTKAGSAAGCGSAGTGIDVVGVVPGLGRAVVADERRAMGVRGVVVCRTGFAGSTW